MARASVSSRFKRFAKFSKLIEIAVKQKRGKTFLGVGPCWNEHNV